MLAGGVQTDATTPNIVGPRMLGVVASVLAGGLQIRIQQLPTILGPAVHHRKVTTHKTLLTACNVRAWPQQYWKTVKALNPGSESFQKVEFDRLGERSPE